MEIYNIALLQATYSEVLIGIDFWGSTGARPLNNLETPMRSSVITTSPPDLSFSPPLNMPVEVLPVQLWLDRNDLSDI